MVEPILRPMMVARWGGAGGRQVNGGAASSPMVKAITMLEINKPIQRKKRGNGNAKITRKGS
ncbi:hypothetical protein CHS0354_034218 [Potamilus streckersoni]|uniref:Uncharacterized protein n=1 Tax=Potamilus streckersoni TaxID=2493646 RepID=A0AAE0T2J9_9BIVA|nr:hypothetical protein CHS0354_034218 [Potamilus streckersoni]